MTKIVIFAPTFHPNNSGYSNACTHLALALEKAGGEPLQVDVALGDATPPTGSRLTVSRILPASVGRLPERIQWFSAQLWGGIHLRKRLRDESIDLIFAETFEYSVALYVATIFQPWHRLRKLTVRIHAATETEFFTFSRHPVFRILYWFARRAAHKLPNIASTSPYYLTFIRQLWFRGDIFATFKNYLVLPNTLNDRPARTRTLPEDGTLDLLALGRMSSVGYNQKNFELIAEAVHIILRSRPELFKRLRITLVGEGEMRAPFERLLARLGIESAFRMVPRLSNTEVQTLQLSCTAALLVSRYEGISMFALECLSAGAPLIVTADTALEDLVEDNVNGFRVSSHDASELAAAINRLTNVDLGAFSTNARALFESRFGPDVIASKLLTFAEYARASEKPPRGRM